MSHDARKLIKFSRSENCIPVQTICKDGGEHRYNNRSSSFYFLKREIEKLLTGEKDYILSKDGWSFATVQVREGVMEFCVSWLHSCGSKLKGEYEYFNVDFNKFREWYYTEIEVLRMLHIPQSRKRPILNFSRTGKLSKVLENPILRRKFTKVVTRFLNYDADEINFYDDHMDYSFEWSEWRNGKRLMNGGLIFHKDHDDRDNLTKGHYNVHT